MLDNPRSNRPILSTALITGASRGLGRGLARTLALDHGVRVGLVARGREALEQVADEIRVAGGVAIPIVADVADKHAIHRIAGEASAQLGNLDILVHAASVLGPTPLRLLLDSECEDFEAVLHANLLGPFRLSKLVIGSMLLRGRGVVLDVSSDAATEAYPGWGLYGVSKAALDQLGRIWAAELAGTGVRVLTVDPGEMNTQMHADALPDADPSTLADPDAVARVLTAMIFDPERAPNGARLSASRWVGEEVQA